MRKFYAGWQGADFSWKQAETVQLRRLCTRFKEYLQPQANSKERYAAPDSVDQRFAHLLFVESPNQRRIVSYPRQEQGFRLCNVVYGICAFGLGTEPLERECNGRHVSGSIVDDGDSHSSPLVLGKTFRRRLSFATANRNARANVLNAASTW